MQNLTFKDISNNSQDQMKGDTDSIKRSKNIYIFSDKSNSLYENDVKHNKLLVNNISKTYKKSYSTLFNTINREAKNIAEKYGIAERVDCFAKSNEFFTLKDHKENFQ